MNKRKKAQFSFFAFLPIFRGKLRISRFFYSDKEKLRTKKFIRIKYGLILKVPSLIDSIGYELFINGIYEKKLVDYLIKSIPKNGILLDVGANIGAICILVAYKRPDIQVYAFEASPYIFGFLNTNKDLNRVSNLHIYNYAVHNTNNISFKFYAPADQFGKGSFHQTYTNKEEFVSTITLDTFLSTNRIIPDLIKVDVQGFELNVFQGINSFIKYSSKKPDIIFEFEDWAEAIALGKENISMAQKYLLDLGYAIYQFDRPRFPILDCLLKEGSRELIAKYHSF